MGRVLTLSRSFGVCIDFFSRWLNFDRQFSNREESYRQQTRLADSICAESSELERWVSIGQKPPFFGSAKSAMLYRGFSPMRIGGLYGGERLDAARRLQLRRVPGLSSGCTE
jgi:hypothetical protein